MRLTRLIRSAEEFTELWKEILDYVEHFEIGDEVERTKNRVKKVEGKFCYQQKAGVLFGVYGPKGGLKHYVAEVFKVRRTKSGILIVVRKELLEETIGWEEII